MINEWKENNRLGSPGRAPLGGRRLRPKCARRRRQSLPEDEFDVCILEGWYRPYLHRPLED